MTHSLVMNYGLYKKMEIFVRRYSACLVQQFADAACCVQRAKPATRKEMAQFHTDDYVDFLARATPDLIEAAMDGGNANRESAASNRAASIIKEMGRCAFVACLSSECAC